MADKLKLVQNDTRPNLDLYFTDEQTGAPIDISGAAVTVNMRRVGETVSYKRMACGYTDAVNGRAFLDWSTDPTALAEAGDFEAEVEVVFSDTRKQTVYELLRIFIRETF